MRKQTNRYLLLGCAFGFQLLCAIKGYSNKIEYPKINPVRKTSARSRHDAVENGRKENVFGSNDSGKKALEKISGKVTGPDGKGLAGVSIQVKGSKGGVLTGADGSFLITAVKGDVLIISSVGFDSKEV